MAFPAVVSEEEITRLAAGLGKRLKERGLKVATAESCTGGWLGQAITSVGGSSQWYERGFITYSNEAKQEMLGVRLETIARHGAVSEQVAREMAEGALARSRAELGIAVTGIAGPEGGSTEKPVGTVCFAWAHAGRLALAETKRFGGDRAAIRAHSVAHALAVLNKLLFEPER
ncbi:MAG: nicotinamide-nucleotide amidase [Gammaproteobacteria bacterium]